MIALFLGTAIAVGALAFVLMPLLREPRVAVDPRTSHTALPEEEQSAVDALREIEFDRATGKLSDTDYAALKARYTGEALAELRASQATGDLSDDAVEGVVLAYRTKRSDCPVCGPRPEPDATYCSECGRFLKGSCGRCGAPVAEEEARFCASCGSSLAA